VRAVESLFEICHAGYFGFNDHLSKSTALVGANALVRCKEGQVFAVGTVTLVRDRFSTNFSTFLLKSFALGGVASVESSRMTDSFPDRKKRKTLPFTPVRSPFSGKSFSLRFFDAAIVRMLE
jgi:hypothetical protein